MLFKKHIGPLGILESTNKSNSSLGMALEHTENTQWIVWRASESKRIVHTMNIIGLFGPSKAQQAPTRYILALS